MPLNTTEQASRTENHPTDSFAYSQFSPQFSPWVCFLHPFRIYHHRDFTIMTLSLTTNDAGEGCELAPESDCALAAQAGRETDLWPARVCPAHATAPPALGTAGAQGAFQETVLRPGSQPWRIMDRVTSVRTGAFPREAPVSRSILHSERRFPAPVPGMSTPPSHRSCATIMTGLDHTPSQHEGPGGFMADLSCSSLISSGSGPAGAISDPSILTHPHSLHTHRSLQVALPPTSGRRVAATRLFSVNV